MSAESSTCLMSMGLPLGFGKETSANLPARLTFKDVAYVTLSCRSLIYLFAAAFVRSYCAWYIFFCWMATCSRPFPIPSFLLFILSSYRGRYLSVTSCSGSSNGRSSGRFGLLSEIIYYHSCSLSSGLEIWFAVDYKLQVLVGAFSFY